LIFLPGGKYRLGTILSVNSKTNLIEFTEFLRVEPQATFVLMI
jgi:hypothetical protein